MNILKGTFLVAVLAVLALSCSSANVQQGAPNAEVINKTITAKAVHEDCMKAMPGQKIVYYFNTSMPVNFNIHYHDAGEVTYGVVQQGASRVEVSTYQVPIEQYYCLMWTNTNAAEVALEYAYNVTD